MNVKFDEIELVVNVKSQRHQTAINISTPAILLTLTSVSNALPIQIKESRFAYSSAKWPEVIYEY